jgi:hypothetical protein
MLIGVIRNRHKTNNYIAYTSVHISMEAYSNYFEVKEANIGIDPENLTDFTFETSKDVEIKCGREDFVLV